jgi:hypothetical protein
VAIAANREEKPEMGTEVSTASQEQSLPGGWRSVLLAPASLLSNNSRTRESDRNGSGTAAHAVGQRSFRQPVCDAEVIEGLGVHRIRE